MTAKPAPKVLCVGRTYSDLLFTGVSNPPQLGEEVFSEHMEIHAGGGAYITAAYLADSGVNTALCTFLPSGPIGMDVSQKIQRSNIDLSHCETSPLGSEPQITVAISCASDRSFLTNRCGPSLPKSIHTALDDPELTHLHIAEVATLAENPDLARMAKIRGLSVSLDCSWDEALLSGGQAIGLLESVDVFLPNEKEIRVLLGISGELVDHASEIADLAPIVAIKQGEHGATLFSEGNAKRFGANAASMIDSTGAGDAFNAGFVASWLAGMPLDQCMEAGNILGGRAVQYVGGASSIQPELPKRKTVV